jgi:hypothetical protein
LRLKWRQCRVHAATQLPCRRGALLRTGLPCPLQGGLLLLHLPLEQRRRLLLLLLLSWRLQHGGQQVLQELKKRHLLLLLLLPLPLLVQQNGLQLLQLSG